MSQAADLAIIALAAGTVAFFTFVGVMAWRLIRKVRKWRARLELILPRAMSKPAPDLLASVWSHAYGTSLAAGAMVRSGSRREAMWLRRDLWWHVTAAEAAVKTASAAGTPVGQLPHLVGHLRDQARRHDQALILASKGVPVPAAVDPRIETGRIINQADSVSAAVVEALRSDAVIDDRSLSTELDHETRSVSHGAARVHSLTDASGWHQLPPPPDWRLPSR